jgi:hypothetical protein
MMKTTKITTMLGLLALLAGSAHALTIDGASSGVFQNPTGGPGLVDTGVGTSHFTWGTAVFGSFPSSLLFAGNPSFSAPVETEFSVGTLTYSNGTISASSAATSVDLKITLSITAPTGHVENFVYGLTLVNTPNSGTADQQADYVYLPSLLPTEIFTVDNVKYTLKLRFGQTTADGFSEIDKFHVREEKGASADLIGKITTEIIPEPSTALLVGCGLMGTLAIRRRKS